MIFKVTHAAGLVEKVLTPRGTEENRRVIETKVEGLDVVQAISQWQTIYSGANTVPTNQILSIVAL